VEKKRDGVEGNRYVLTSKGRGLVYAISGEEWHQAKKGGLQRGGRKVFCQRPLIRQTLEVKEKKKRSCRKSS